MQRFSIVGTLLAALLAVTGCNEGGDTIDRVQTNLVDKTIFEGDWWYAQTVIDVDGDAANVLGTFSGSMSFIDLGANNHAGWPRGLDITAFHMARIRWVIDQDHLFAYRAYELIDGGNDDGREEEFRGQPLAVFAIQSHADVRRDYNAVTGEVTNVRVEDSADRRWYERNFMRVDWSQNLISSFYYLPVAQYDAVSAPFHFDEGSHLCTPEEEDNAEDFNCFPSSYQPQFTRVADDPTYRFADEWPAGNDDTVHYMSFVTQELYSPGVACLFFGVPCQTAAVTIRNSFLRVPPEHEYAVGTQTHAEYDRFGLFRTNQRTYIRGGADEEVTEGRCATDADCGIGGLCDSERHICVGGLSADHGERDFLTFYRPRHNFFRDHFARDAEGATIPCAADWQCDNRYGDLTGTPGAGSVCDRSAGVCTMPLTEREHRTVTYTLNAGFPQHLVDRALHLTGEWNESFMRGWRGARGEPLPVGSPIECQNDNPGDYCFCGSPDVSDATAGTCQWRWNPFLRPEASGSTNPYDCWIETTGDYTAPTNPTSFEDYPAPAVFQQQFVGSECMFVLRTNACDRVRTDPSQSCDEAIALAKDRSEWSDDQLRAALGVGTDGDIREARRTLHWEGLGDIRYQFFNYIEHGNLYFGGVSIPMVDPTTGEFITSNANMAGESIESVGSAAITLFPVLRGEAGADLEYFEGEQVRDYFATAGDVRRPTTVAPSGSDGVPGDDRSRPGLMPADMHGHMMATMEAAAPRIQALHGADGRAQIMSDRVRALAGTAHETRLVESLGLNGRDLIHSTLDPRQLDPNMNVRHESSLDAISPYRDGFLSNLTDNQDVWARLGRMNIDPPRAPELKNGRFRYWANAFAGRPAGEASIRVQQVWLAAVMLHEYGHSVGLRHNFGGSFDRNNYYDGYFNTVLRDDAAIGGNLAIPDLEDYDLPALGGDASGFVDGVEVNNYINRLREVRDRRDELGVANTMGASIMDYHGDLSDTSGLGRYDSAAANWSHFDVLEAYEGDPRIASGDSFNNMHDAANTDRTFFTYYAGGDNCSTDSECPYAEGRMSGQPLYQRCIRNARRSRLPTPCDGDSACTCSSFDEDFLDYVDGVAYDNDTDGDGALDHYPIKYMFCSDDRVRDISWCNRFDAGESFQESIDHFRRRWTEGYPFSYYRRFRRGGPSAGASWLWISMAAKIYQHLFFRYFNEPGFRSDEGPLGFDNQFLASVDGMNWIIEMATLPDPGSYELDRARGVYELVSDEMDAADSLFSIPLGQGYPKYSEYEEGFYGFFRLDRSGVLIDKYLALIALTLRDWNLDFTIDERYFINYNDLFETEMAELFGGFILDDANWFSPRFIPDGSGRGDVQYLSWYRGTCRVDGDLQPCRGANPDVYPETPIDGTSTNLLRFIAAERALAEFPVFYDTSFEQRLLIFKRGAGEGFDIPAVQSDGGTTCAYGDRLSAAHDLFGAGCDDADYVIYSSDRFHTDYVALKARTRLTYNLEEEQLGFQLLRRMVDRQDRIRVLRRIAMPTAREREELVELEDRQVTDESFIESLIDLQRLYGITSYLF